MKNFIKKLSLRWSDLFLLIGFLPFTFFLIFGQLFMQYTSPNDVAFPIWAIILCFVLSIGGWGVYLYLEFKAGHRPKDYVTWTFASLLVIGVIAIVIQPSLFSENVIVRVVNEGNISLGKEVGEIVNVNFVISPTHYVFFVFDLILILLFVYIGLFIFPKRFTSLSFVKYLGYGVLGLMAALTIYSYIFEFKNYIGFFKCLVGKGEPGVSIYAYAVKSFILHRNAYGMAMMLGIIFCFINHSIEHKWWYYLIAGFLFVNMLFSLCKTGILISVILVLIYVIYRLIVTFKEHKKRNKIILITGGSILGVTILVVGVSYLTKGKFLAPIYSLISSLGGSSTLSSRTFIWDNVYQLLRNGWWLIGRGFGLLNEMLLPMNTVNGDAVFPAHSAFLTLLGEGGIIYLLGYLVLMGYTVYVIINCFKYKRDLTVAFSLGIIAFTLYSFVEAIHYLVYVFLFPMMILYHLSTLQVEKKEA